MRVLVVEDEEYLAEAIATGLRREAMAVDVVGDGASALEQVAVNDYDIIVLDRDLPVVHGDEVCRRVVRDYPSTRVLMLTASRTLDARVGGFELGADDYLTKPFEFPELVARLRALGQPGSTRPGPWAVPVQRSSSQAVMTHPPATTSQRMSGSGMKRWSAGAAYPPAKAPAPTATAAPQSTSPRAMNRIAAVRLETKSIGVFMRTASWAVMGVPSMHSAKKSTPAPAPK